MTEPALTVYEKSSCSTCRNLGRLLRERGVDFERVEYILEPLSADQLRALIRKLDVPAHELVRTREQAYLTSGLGPGSSEDEIVAALAARPALMQRPVVVRGDRAVIARPIEKVLDIL